jgi:hypothetical protein
MSNIAQQPYSIVTKTDEGEPAPRIPEQRAAFFDWLDAAAAYNAEHNTGLIDAQVLAIIDQARCDVDAEAE